jgi:Uma2 family endonuclease
VGDEAADRGATTIARVQGWPGYPTQHPEARHAYLVLEVSDATWLADRTIEAGLYARSNAGEYWIVDLTADEVVVHRDPRNGTYAFIERRRGDYLLQMAALPAISMAVSSIFE